MKGVSLEEEARLDNEAVADWLLMYEERRQEYLELLEDAACPVGVDLSQPRANTNAVSDPTARAAIRLAETNYSAWLAVVEEVERRLSWRLQVFLRLRREHRHARGNQGWVVQVQRRYAEVVAAKTGEDIEDTWISSRTTFTVWWRQIIEYTVRAAARRGLLGG